MAWPKFRWTQKGCDAGITDGAVAAHDRPPSFDTRSPHPPLRASATATAIVRASSGWTAIAGDTNRRTGSAAVVTCRAASTTTSASTGSLWAEAPRTDLRRPNGCLRQ